MSRQMVIDYLNSRVLSAWTKGQDEEASSCLRFVQALEAMTDAEYVEVYEAEVEVA